MLNLFIKTTLINFHIGAIIENNGKNSSYRLRRIYWNAFNQSLLQDGYSVYGIDNINNYYDQTLKKIGLKLVNHKNLLSKRDICIQVTINNIFKNTNQKSNQPSSPGRSWFQSQNQKYTSSQMLKVYEYFRDVKNMKSMI